ncbi:hypothetical protein HY407_01415 [Candidatus Gottesmanbacteria bacterium]|nr:hypothetical protein [Candidatus Gottesmanbacteria bacterium]
MAMAEAPAMMGQGRAFGPMRTIPGQGGDVHGFDKALAMGAVVDMLVPKKIQSLAEDATYHIRENILKKNIDTVSGKVKKQQVKYRRFGDGEVVNTVVFDKFGGKAWQDVTLETTEGGALWDRINRISSSVANTPGESWHAWLSPGKEEQREMGVRFYVAHNDGDGNVDIHSTRLYHIQEESLWNLVDTLDGKQHKRTENIRDITIVRNQENNRGPLDVREVVSVYTESLSTSETQLFAPFLYNLWAEAALPKEARKLEREEQERLVEKEIKKVFEEKFQNDSHLQQAIGAVAQAIPSWVTYLERMAESREERKGEIRTQHQSDRVESKNRQEVKGLTHYEIVSPGKDVVEITGDKNQESKFSYADYLAKRLRERSLWKPKSGGRRFRKWRRLAELQLAGMVILPRKSKLWVEDVGPELLKKLRKGEKSEIYHYKKETSPYYLAKTRGEREIKAIRSGEVKVRKPVVLTEKPKEQKAMSKSAVIPRKMSVYAPYENLKSLKVGKIEKVEKVGKVEKVEKVERVEKKLGIVMQRETLVGKVDKIEKVEKVERGERARKKLSPVEQRESRKGRKGRKWTESSKSREGRGSRKGRKENKLLKMAEKLGVGIMRERMKKEKRRVKVERIGRIERVEKVKRVEEVEKSRKSRKREMRKIRSILRLIGKLEKIIDPKNEEKIKGRKKLILAKDKKIILRWVTLIWGKENPVVSRLKDGKDIRKVFKKLKKENILRLKKLEKKSRKEFKKRLLVRKYAPEQKQPQKSGSRPKRRVKISAFAEKNVRKKIKRQKVERRLKEQLIFDGNGRKNGQIELRFDNFRLINFNLDKQSLPIITSAEKLSSLNGTSRHLMGTKNKKVKSFPKYGIIYRYKNVRQIAYMSL